MARTVASITLDTFETHSILQYRSSLSRSLLLLFSSLLKFVVLVLPVLHDMLLLVETEITSCMSSLRCKKALDAEDRTARKRSYAKLTLDITKKEISNVKRP
jgi:hypothetical protein